jgi:hypothetical protein
MANDETTPNSTLASITCPLMPIRRTGFGFKGEPPRNFLNLCDVIQYMLKGVRLLKISRRAATCPMMPVRRISFGFILASAKKKNYFIVARI